ncbi:hypothetical protein [Caldivirga maquilingensis]|uniref:Uncharacterized protein n=1 Tax=Caldivirga maquilingensis (strain ATCC 700844 / DSM 13496 / JCM 10307 / IC-167) TaxID=397948 RepID=A8MCM4_CALMQ|nr:hypothetical protein [Caldivirga maquilingensis]ABW01530.1 conserved hypothetical protein [Caldivirga maquilingensis IC-167]
MVNIYMGRESCYAVKEGVYVKPGPMDLGRAAAHLYLHLRDLKLGYTYNHDCVKIRMSRSLFEARCKYLVKLCREQINDEYECSQVEQLVNAVLSNMKLPQWAEELVKQYLVKVTRLI